MFAEPAADASTNHTSLQAELLVADGTTTLTVSGNGDVLEPLGDIMAIGTLPTAWVHTSAAGVSVRLWARV